MRFTAAAFLAFVLLLPFRAAPASAQEGEGDEAVTRELSADLNGDNNLEKLVAVVGKSREDPEGVATTVSVLSPAGTLLASTAVEICYLEELSLPGLTTEDRRPVFCLLCSSGAHFMTSECGLFRDSSITMMSMGGFVGGGDDGPVDYDGDGVPELKMGTCTSVGECAWGIENWFYLRWTGSAFVRFIPGGFYETHIVERPGDKRPMLLGYRRGWLADSVELWGPVAGLGFGLLRGVYVPRLITATEDNVDGVDGDQSYWNGLDAPIVGFPVESGYQQSIDWLGVRFLVDAQGRATAQESFGDKLTRATATVWSAAAPRLSATRALNVVLKNLFPKPEVKK